MKKKLVAMVLICLFLVTLSGCGSQMSKEDMLKEAGNPISLLQMDSEFQNNSHNAEGKYCDKIIQAEGYLSSIDGDYAVFTSYSLTVKVKLSDEDLDKLNTEYRYTFVGKTEPEIKTEKNGIIFGFDVPVITMKQGYIVADRHEQEVTIWGENRSYEGAYDYQIGDNNYLSLIYFANDVDPASIPIDKKITVEGRFERDGDNINIRDAHIK